MAEGHNIGRKINHHSYLGLRSGDRNISETYSDYDIPQCFNIFYRAPMILNYGFVRGYESEYLQNCSKNKKQIELLFSLWHYPAFRIKKLQMRCIRKKWIVC